jgi:hypothetical protein
MMAEDLEKQTRQRLRDEEVLDRDRQKNRDEIARLQSNQAAVDNDEVPVEKISEKTHRIVVEVQEKPKKAPKANSVSFRLGPKHGRLMNGTWILNYSQYSLRRQRRFRPDHLLTMQFLLMRYWLGQTF